MNGFLPSPAACGGSVSGRRTLRFVTFLAPNLYWFYEYLTRYAAARLDWPAELVVGTSYAELPDADVAFVCGLPYVESTRGGAGPVEPLAAPVLCGPRYAGQPIYFSDVVVQRASPFQSFADLRGRSWAYNEPHSQSGYGITRHHLLCRGEIKGYFGCVVEAGWHEASLRLVCAGQVDASAIDSHVLAIALRDQPALAEQLRVIAVLGPSPIQPIVAARRLPGHIKECLRSVFLGLADDPAARPYLERALVRRFVAADDATYEPLHAMREAAERAGFLSVR